ncbi:MAG: hypothetical protein OEQ18_06920 [Gammaproteobacteria bacterium]|nr:hypothetical protein [Gammaproteobacteria bacterium]
MRSTEPGWIAGNPARLSASSGAFTAWIAGVFSVLAIGCASAPGLTPITSTAQRMDFRGVSVQPPQGDNWYTAAAQRGPPGTLVAFYKKMGDWTPEHSAIAGLRLLDLDDQRFETAEELGRFMDQVFREDHKRSTRFNLIDSTYAVDASFGAICVRLHQAQEDREVPGRAGQRFLIDAHAIRCIHPRSPRYLVDISFSERRRDNRASWWSRGLQEEVEPYLNSLQFLPLE